MLTKVLEQNACWAVTQYLKLPTPSDDGNGGLHPTFFLLFLRFITCHPFL